MKKSKKVIKMLKKSLKNRFICKKLYAMYSYDYKLFEHSVCIAISCAYTGIELKLSDKEVMNLIYMGFLHDLGKMGLNKNNLFFNDALLTADEKEKKYFNTLVCLNELDYYGRFDCKVKEGIKQYHYTSSSTVSLYSFILNTAENFVNQHNTVLSHDLCMYILSIVPEK